MPHSGTSQPFDPGSGATWIGTNGGASAARDVGEYREGESPTRYGIRWAFLGAVVLGLALMGILWILGALP
jgi:hypothetical protein